MVQSYQQEQYDWTRKPMKLTMFIVHSNLKREAMMDGMAPSNIQNGLNISNYGVTLLHHYPSTSAWYNQLVVWREVLHGHDDNLQVWEKRSHFRNLFESFRNQQTTDLGPNRFINAVHKELFCNQVQCAYMIAAFYCAQANYFPSICNKDSKVIMKPTNDSDMSISGDIIKFLSKRGNHIFDINTKQSHSNICVVSKPILSNKDIIKIIEDYKSTSLLHYQAMVSILRPCLSQSAKNFAFWQKWKFYFLQYCGGK